MTLRRLVCVLADLLFGASSSVRADVARYLRKPVLAVRVEVDGRPQADASLLQIIETRVGQPLSMNTVRQTVSHLYSVGRFDDVEVFAAEEAGGVTLRFALVPRRPVARISFTGTENLPVNDGVLRDVVIERFGTSPPPQRGNALAEPVVDELHRLGYLRARVTVSPLVDRTMEQTTLIFAVEAGHRARIRSLKVTGTIERVTPPLHANLDLRVGEPWLRDVANERVEHYV